LGFRLVSDEDFALIFETPGAILRVQKVERFVPQPFTALGWQVENIAAKVSELRTRGVEFERFSWMPQDSLGIWQAENGDQVAWFKDPVGNLLSLTQINSSEGIRQP
jgi:hypothetical protein